MPNCWLQLEGTEKPQTNTRVPQEKGQANATEGKVIADYKLNVDYKPKWSDPKNEPNAQKEEEKSNAECAKME